MPLFGPPGPAHVPPGSGVPDKLLNRSTGPLTSQINRNASPPGSGACTLLIVTEAESTHKLPSITV